MQELFYVLLGAVFCGYFALAGYDYGVGALLSAVARTDHERRATLGALGPFFLGNEVWLVAGLGMLVGAFPLLDGVLLSAVYPVVTPLIAAIVVFTAAVQVRSRFVKARVLWDWIIVVSATLTAFGWGAMLGFMLQGFPLRFGPLPVLTGALTTALFVMHGAGLLSVRAPEPVRGRAARIAAGIAGPVALVLTVAASLTVSVFDRAIAQPLPAVGLVLLLLCAIWASRAWHRRGRHGLGFAATVAASALPVAIVGVAPLPFVFVHSDSSRSLTFSDAVASGPTLDFLAIAVLPLIPLLVAFQVATWWIWRRVPDRPIFY